jgi:KUP system potassium uptake protein
MVVFTLMSTWKTGRRILGERLRASSLPLSLFLQDVGANPPLRVKGTAIFLSGNVEGTPIALLHNLKHNKVLHERVVILNISTADIPHVAGRNRVEIEELQANFFRVVGKFGFMEDPNVPEIINQCTRKGFSLDDQDTTFFLSRETVIPTPHKGMALWRERLFSIMSRNAQSATAFFRIPPNRVVELGMQVEI